VNNAEEKTIILASGSPRRRELLSLTGLSFKLAKADIDETPRLGESAANYTVRLSQEKARAVMRTVTDKALILAADTTVADGDVILGKPADAGEAWVMLRRLRGRVHQVYTALTLIDTASGRRVTEVAVTNVPMRAYTDAEIEDYIASGDPFDKAGGYAIQNAFFHPVAALSGCYANVVGLPLCHLLRALRGTGLVPDGDVPLRCQQHYAYDCDVTGSILASQPSAWQQESER
jgi:septum formation protein